MEQTQYTDTNQGEIVCQCGAKLKFKPGTTHLKCEYCDAEHEIEIAPTAIEEIDFEEYISKSVDAAPKKKIITSQCSGCGAATTFKDNLVSTICPFCGSPLVAESKSDDTIIQPASLLPFKIEKSEAIQSFKTWLKKIWFAPNELKKFAIRGKLVGMYIPYWTYDADTKTAYRGERGDHYQVQESYTDSEGNRKTRTVTKTRWSSTSGNVSDTFDDVLVVASNSLPQKYIDKLEPWDLKQLTPYNDKFLTGFETERYQIDVKNGFTIAKQKMEHEIRRTVKRDIGGDEQRIHSLDTKYYDTTFKHILLPLWISTYKYKNKPYRFMINARTGEVQGERPYSWIKITLAILVAIAIIVTIYLLVR